VRQDDIDAAAAAAVTPAARLIIALAGIHAARSSTICSVLLADADPASPRLLLAGPAPWTTSLPACCEPGWRTAGPDGPAPPTRTCSSTPIPPLAPGRSAGPGSPPPCAATPPPPRHSESIASLKKPSPPAPTPSTWPPPSAWTPPPQSAMHPAPASSSRPLPSSRTRPGSQRTQGHDPPPNPENPSVPADHPSERLNSGDSEAPAMTWVSNP
jgi:hypothetical protein